MIIFILKINNFKNITQTGSTMWQGDLQVLLATIQFRLDLQLL